MSSRILLDTGPIVAVLGKSDEHHSVCVEQLQHLTGTMVTCWPVITEAAWLLRAYPQQVDRLLAMFEEDAFEILPLHKSDVHGIATILRKYERLRLQIADAAVLHLANREDIETIFTLDRRDFGVLRLAHGKKPRLIP